MIGCAKNGKQGNLNRYILKEHIVCRRSCGIFFFIYDDNPKDGL